MKIESTRPNTETFNFVVGYYKDVNGISRGETVSGIHEGVEKRLVVDHSRPVTLVRCSEILKTAEKLMQRELTKIEICWSVFSKSEGNCSDCAEECFEDKKYVYTKSSNSLVIWDKDTPVYANDNGQICRDQAALCDSLFD